MNRSQQASSGGGASTGFHILVVDDEQPVRFVAQKMLQRLGHNVELAGNAAEALAAAAKPTAAFDLALVDLRLGEESGLEVAVALQRACNNMPVVIMGGDLVEHARDRHGAGAPRHLLPKPFSLSELDTVIAASISGAGDDRSTHADTCLPGPDHTKIDVTHG